jgi:hypothetical protein
LALELENESGPSNDHIEALAGLRVAKKSENLVGFFLDKCTGSLTVFFSHLTIATWNATMISRAAYLVFAREIPFP